MGHLDCEIAAYEKIQESLEANHFGEWVVFYNGQLFGTYSEFVDATDEAIRNFGRGPYLIRQVGRDPSEPLPCVVYHVR